MWCAASDARCRAAALHGSAHVHRRLLATVLQRLGSSDLPGAYRVLKDTMMILRSSAQGCLLVGPPGTGKTLLGTLPMCFHVAAKGSSGASVLLLGESS